MDNLLFTFAQNKLKSYLKQDTQKHAAHSGFGSAEHSCLQKGDGDKRSQSFGKLMSAQIECRPRRFLDSTNFGFEIWLLEALGCKTPYTNKGRRLFGKRLSTN